MGPPSVPKSISLYRIVFAEEAAFCALTEIESRVVARINSARYGDFICGPPSARPLCLLLTFVSVQKRSRKHHISITEGIARVFSSLGGPYPEMTSNDVAFQC